MRSRTDPDLRGRCRRCHVVERFCLCADVPSLRNRTRVLVLRHENEAHKSTNTARLAGLALSDVELVDWTSRAPPDVEGWLGRHGMTWLVFPGTSTVDPARERPDALLLLDGTWRQAKKMFLSHPVLWRLPRLSLPPPRSVPRRLRAPPNAEAQSTIEAIAGALRLIEGGGIAEPLEELHALAVERTLRARGTLRTP